MKLILANKTEIDITRVNINYNSGLLEEEKTITVTIDEPTITSDAISELLTEENIAHVEFVSDVKTIVKEGLKKVTLSENLNDTTYSIDIRMS